MCSSPPFITSHQVPCRLLLPATLLHLLWRWLIAPHVLQRLRLRPPACVYDFSQDDGGEGRMMRAPVFVSKGSGCCQLLPLWCLLYLMPDCPMCSFNLCIRVARFRAPLILTLRCPQCLTLLCLWIRVGNRVAYRFRTRLHHSGCW